MILVASGGLLPMASADDSTGCVSTVIDTYASGLGFVLDPVGQTILFSVRSGVPGDGIAMSVLISPADCDGLPGVEIGDGEDDNGFDPIKMANGVRSLLPLP